MRGLVVEYEWGVRRWAMGKGPWGMGREESMMRAGLARLTALIVCATPTLAAQGPRAALEAIGELFPRWDRKVP